MIDPSALGTLLIGLSADDRGSRHDRRRRSVTAPRRQRVAIRVALASGLRRAASRLDRPAISEGAQ